MKPESITIVSFGYFEKKFPGEICNEIEQEFQVPVITREGHLDLSEFFDPTRKQYDGNKLLKEIEIRFDLRVHFHESVGGDAITPFFHVAEVIGRPAFEQAQVAGDRQAVDHAGGGVFLIAGAASIQDAVFDFADEGVPLPLSAVANADGVDM